MTKDLALAIHGKAMQREHWVVTDVYMDAVKVSVIALCWGVKCANASFRLSWIRSS